MFLNSAEIFFEMRCSLIARCLDGVVVVCEATAAIFSGCPHVLCSGKKLPMRDESAPGEHPNDEGKYRSKSAGRCPSMLHEGQER